MFSSVLAFLRPGSPRPGAPRRAASASLSVERLDERCLPSAGLTPAPPAVPAVVAPTQGDHQVPFHLAGSGQLDLATGDFTASGEATQLGHWTNTGHLDLVPVVVNGTPLVHATGQVTFVAANGDTVSMAIDGFADPVTGHATATFTITGGTGRFRNATGAEHMELDQNFATGAFTFTLDGTISTAGSSQDEVATALLFPSGVGKGILKKHEW
jgi:hypothetical protein